MTTHFRAGLGGRLWRLAGSGLLIAAVSLSLAAVPQPHVEAALADGSIVRAPADIVESTCFAVPFGGEVCTDKPFDLLPPQIKNLYKSEKAGGSGTGFGIKPGPNLPVPSATAIGTAAPIVGAEAVNIPAGNLELAGCKVELHNNWMSWNKPSGSYSTYEYMDGYLRTSGCSAVKESRLRTIIVHWCSGNGHPSNSSSWSAGSGSNSNIFSSISQTVSAVQPDKYCAWGTQIRFYYDVQITYVTNNNVYKVLRDCAVYSSRVSKGESPIVWEGWAQQSCGL